MICRYFLHIDSEVIDVSNMIENLSDIKITYTRTGLNGVSRKCGSTLKFVSDARDMLVGLFSRDGVNANASFSISRTTNNWELEEAFVCQLDFSSFSSDALCAFYCF